MISVRFQPSREAEAIVVQIDPKKHSIEAVLQRAAERVFPDPVNAKAEAESERRFQEIMRERQVRKVKRK